MRQIIDYPAMASYSVTATATELQGYIIQSVIGCSITVNSLTKTLPYTLLANDVLAINHTAGVGVLSSIRYSLPDDGNQILTTGGVTASRPAAPVLYQQYFDTTLNKLILATSLAPTVWKDTMGLTV